MPSWFQKVKSRAFLAFHLEFFGRMGWAAMLPLHWLLLCLRVTVIQPGFVHGHQSCPTGNHLDHAEKNPEVAQTIGNIDVFDPRSGILGPSIYEGLGPRRGVTIYLSFHGKHNIYRFSNPRCNSAFLIYGTRFFLLHFKLPVWSLCQQMMLIIAPKIPMSMFLVFFIHLTVLQSSTRGINI